MQAFSASVLLPVMDETFSLKKTVEIIRQTSDADIKEFIFIVCKKTKPESLSICQEFVATDSKRFVLLWQTRPFLGGAIRDAFAIARGTHTIMMASDLETDPSNVQQLIAEAKKAPDSIVTASRWINGVGFSGYNPIKLAANFIFQNFFRILYGTKLSDLTYGYRIFPTRLVQSIAWEGLRHDFLFETAIKPLRLGIKISEIPTAWKARQEGESQNTFLRNFVYFKIGFRVRFMPKSEVTCESTLLQQL